MFFILTNWMPFQAASFIEASASKPSTELLLNC